MPRGNPDNLRAAAERKRTRATERAEAALAELVRRGEPITFRGLAKAAGVSVDFLYRSMLRPRIEEFRATAPIAASAASGEQTAAGESQVVRALAAQSCELKRRHRDEIGELRAALPPRTARTSSCAAGSRRAHARAAAPEHGVKPRRSQSGRAEQRRRSRAGRLRPGWRYGRRRWRRSCARR